MPTRKQRRRREKTFRHEYGFVDYDEEGNEIEVDPSALRAEKPKREKPKAAPVKDKRGRTVREAPPPSWNRALRRGGMWGLGMLAVAVLFFHSMPIAARVVLGVLYAAAFVPLQYWVDRTAYRSYLKRTGRSPDPPS